MITPQELSLVAGVLVSLAAFYFPRVGPWYGGLDSKSKSQVMGLAILVIGVGSFVLGYFCVGPFCLPRPIDLPNQLWQLGVIIVSALISNQGTYTLVRKLQTGVA